MRRLAATLLPLVVLCALASAAAGQDAPFSLQTLNVPGRPLGVFAFPRGHGQHGLAAISVEGMPPDEVRHLTLWPELDARPTRIRVPSEVIALDVADVDPAPGAEVVLLAPGRLLLLGTDGTRLRAIALPPDAALPARTRQVSRLPMVAPWAGRGPAALVPMADGLLVVPLTGSDPPVRLRVPVVSSYETWPPEHPFSRGYLEARLIWPMVALADDDGDGRPDLFAATRFELRVFRNGVGGLSPEPARTRRFAPFSFEEERRHEGNLLRAIPRDLDGDGLADLVVHRTAGTLLASHARTAIFANHGKGADPQARPDATLDVEDGFGAVNLVDIDGDGRTEIVQTSVSFGIVQLARILTRRRAEVRLRVFTFRGKGLSDPEPSWSGEVTLPFDFATARVSTLLPSFDGDWNGDGRRDLIYGEANDRVRIRLGDVGPEGPGFGGPSVRFQVPAAQFALAADLDGDGLDDLVTWDPLDRSGTLQVARNRGHLPGTPAGLRARSPGGS